MTKITRIQLMSADGLHSAEVQESCVTLQSSVSTQCVTIPVDFFSDVVDALIEVTGNNEYEKLEADLRAETARCAYAEAQVRALERQLAAMRALLQPKPTAKFAEQED